MMSDKPVHSSRTGLLMVFCAQAHRYSYTCTEVIVYSAQAHRDPRIDTHIKRINIGGKVRVNFIFTNRLEKADLLR